jgi:hypothetical protein
MLGAAPSAWGGDCHYNGHCYHHPCCLPPPRAPAVFSIPAVVLPQPSVAIQPAIPLLQMRPTVQAVVPAAEPTCLGSADQRMRMLEKELLELKSANEQLLHQLRSMGVFKESGPSHDPPPQPPMPRADRRSL